jgi:hypothetical protein
VDYTLLVRNLVFLGLIAVMPFPVRLLSDYSSRPLAVAIYAVAFITAMGLQRRIWLDVTRPEHRDLLQEPVPDQVRSCRPGGHVRPQVRDPGLGGDHPPPPGRGPAHQLAVMAAHRDLNPSAYPRPAHAG